jgi:beta-N-acetylhexosaminidase
MPHFFSTMNVDALYMLKYMWNKNRKNTLAFFSCSFLPAFLVLCAFFSCDAGARPDTPPEYSALNEIQEKNSAEAAKKNEALTGLMRSLSQTQKLSQIFLVNINGSARFAPVEFDEEQNPAVPGGYILFSYNIADTIEKTALFTASIKKYCNDRAIIPPYLAIDHEGGNVNRLRGLSKNFPSARTVARAFTAQEAEDLYYEQGLLLNSLGIHLNLAPVVETAGENAAPFLVERSYGSVQDVLAFADKALTGYERAGVAASLKHFPGSASRDPHEGAAIISVEHGEFEKNYLESFKVFSARASAILMSHARVFVFDGEKTEGDGAKINPASLSKRWVSDALRNEMGFDGLIISDDIYMAALENTTPPQAAEMAIEAGVTVLLISEKCFLPALNALKERAARDENFSHLLDEAVLRVLDFKAARGIITLEQAEE